MSVKIAFISLFFVLGWRFAGVRLLPFIYATLWILHVPHVFQGSAEQTLFPFVGYLQGFRLKDLCSKPFLPFTEGFLNGHLQWNFWRMASNRRQLRASNHFTWLTNIKNVRLQRSLGYQVSNTYIYWSSFGVEICWLIDLNDLIITYQFLPFAQWKHKIWKMTNFLKNVCP